MKIRTNHFLRCGLALLAGALFPLPYLATINARQTPSAGLSKEGVEFFERKIRPVLVNQCYQCHSSQAKKPAGGLRLDTRAGMLKGGASGEPGIVYGQSDEYGDQVAENEVHVHDFHATILHLLGFDHTRLTYRHGGRDYRLTDVHGNVMKGLLI